MSDNKEKPTVHVVTIGTGRCMEDVHGVFMEETRAKVAAEELRRVYDDHDEWVDVDSHELIMKEADEVER